MAAVLRELAQGVQVDPAQRERPQPVAAQHVVQVQDGGGPAGRRARIVVRTADGLDGVRNGLGSNGYTGVNEVRLRNGRIIREGLQTTLSELRLRKTSKSARARWAELCDCPAIFVLSREVAKLGYFWRHVYGAPRCGPFNGAIVNPDTGRPIIKAHLNPLVSWIWIGVQLILLRPSLP